MLRGSVLAEQGQVEEGVALMQQGLAACQTMGAELGRIRCLPWLAAAYGRVGRVEEGLTVLAEALVRVDKTGARFYEAELYRLKGELTLQQFKVQSSEFKIPSSQHLTSSTQVEECFLKAIELASRQQAKSLELRAVMSLCRLRQHQAQDHAARTTQHETRNMLNEAHRMLSEIYHWFTEGFETKDLQEAKALLEEVSQ
jgi:predicted ATPase